MRDRLVVVGQGYVGLPLALRAAEAGFDVVGFDVHHATVEALNAGRSHIDDVSDEDLDRARAHGYRAATDAAEIAEADVVVVCVPTPLADTGGPDLAAVESSARMIGTYVTSGTLVILESTTYPGTTEEIFAPLVLGDRLSLNDVLVAFSPERIDPGNPTYGVQNTPKVVGGLTPRASEAAQAFYGRFIDVVVPAKGAREAEMAKLLENTFRHVNIALVNEMLRFSDDLGIDLWNAIDCAATKPFGYMAFRPGPGVGGHCIPIDPSYLSFKVKAELGYSFRMVELAEEINRAAPVYVVDRLWLALNDRGLPLKGAEILILGVTYKPNIADCRESPADPLVQRLVSLGAAISYHDPHVAQWTPHGADVGTFECVPDLDVAASRATATVLLQPHIEYDLGHLAEVAGLLLDTRGVVEPSDTVIRL